MNKKIKLFYIVDSLVMIISIICMIIIDSKNKYGLEELTSVGYFTIFLLICIISIVLLIIVAIICFIIKISRKNK